MSAAEIPVDEAQRLATLASYFVLDTPPDPSFDRLVQLAAEYFDVPISLVSLVDTERQWFKASTGLRAQETPREAAFCAHAILHPHDIFIVEDAEEDARFADNPLVTGDPSIRFYAGVPILAEDGQPLGTMCIVDTKARRLDDAGQRFLHNLAGSAGSLLELHRKNLVLAHASGRDPLTGLANRRAFDTALATACQRARDGISFGLLALDLDDFKSVNDRLGHEVGDKLLQEVGRRLSQAVRGVDLVARLGGDEFAIIAAGPGGIDSLMIVARRIMRTLSSDDMRCGSHSVPISTSIGVAMAPMHGIDPRLLSRAADFALYRSKREGRHRITIATAAETDLPPPSVTVEEELRQAIAASTLTLNWQPYSAPDLGIVLGYEALLRWTPAGQGPMPPTDIVVMAEKGGFIDELDKMVLRMACAQAANWPDPLSVSVNMTAWWFSNGDLVGLVMSVLRETGLPAERLVIELTEGTLVQHTELARERIAGLRGQGVRIALDDFGTGYASLGYLNSFDFDIMKLDRTFVQGLGRDRRAEAVARAVVALGRALSMVVCAEGVETPEQLHFLCDAGCDTVQGFLLGRPVARIRWEANAREENVTALEECLATQG